MKTVAWLMGIALLAGGCAPATRVVLLPPLAGATSAVEVTAGPSRAVLSRPYETAEVGERSMSTRQLDAAQVQQRYGRLLAVQPPPEQRLTLFFELGGAQLTAGSTSQLGEVIQQATARPGGEIVVIGHTDRVGTIEANDLLSLQRAQAIRELLIQRGFAAARIEAVGHGEREPLVETADEVAEPRNRRVEIVVR